MATFIDSTGLTRFWGAIKKFLTYSAATATIADADYINFGDASDTETVNSTTIPKIKRITFANLKAAIGVGESPLAANVTYYVNASTGSDSNDGLSSGAALLTIQAAIDKIPSNLAGYSVTISIAAGAYAESVVIRNKKFGQININGAATATVTSTKFLIQGCDNVRIASATLSGASGVYGSSAYFAFVDMTGVGDNLITVGSFIGFEACNLSGQVYGGSGYTPPSTVYLEGSSGVIGTLSGKLVVLGDPRAGKIYTGQIEKPTPRTNHSTAAQTGFAADTYLAGSFIKFAGRPKIGTIYRLKFDMSKTAAGTAAPIISVRFGTTGSTADTARTATTFGAGTAAADNGLFTLEVCFRAVGSGTTAVVLTHIGLTSDKTTTGLSNGVKMKTTVSGGFDSTVTGLGIGVSFNGGTSFSGTCSLVAAELIEPNAA